MDVFSGFVNEIAIAWKIIFYKSQNKCAIQFQPMSEMN